MSIENINNNKEYAFNITDDNQKYDITIKQNQEAKYELNFTNYNTGSKVFLLEREESHVFHWIKGVAVTDRYSVKDICKDLQIITEIIKMPDIQGVINPTHQEDDWHVKITGLLAEDFVRELGD